LLEEIDKFNFIEVTIMIIVEDLKQRLNVNFNLVNQILNLLSKGLQSSLIHNLI